MPADIGEMFYTGETPWHGLGLSLSKPATMEEALKAGGLNWEVGQVDLMTADDPPSPVEKRRAIVRLDRPAGHEGRVLGVAHRGFQPVQNRDGALLFDAIFGQGKAVYHTGGYLGNGEVIWLLAKINRPLEIASGDIVQPYALLANSHDGSMAFNIRLTTVRVVCRNTLALSMREKRFGQQFRRAHQGTLLQHAQAAQEFFGATLKELDFVADSFVALTKRQCDDKRFGDILASLLPEPKKPRNADTNPGLKRAWEKRLEDVLAARRTIKALRENGKGMKLDGSRGTFWGVLNAVLEYIDHHREMKGARISYALLGDGMELKVRAFNMIREEAAKAA
jgi:phage/plasmid-like protein (TIGR03299 family)